MIKKLDWDDYKKWLYDTKNKYYARTLFRISKNYYDFAFSNKLIELPPTRKREDILKGITNLTRYLDIKYDSDFHDEFIQWMKRKEIRWKSSRQLQIPNEIPLCKILENIKTLDDYSKIFAIFGLVSGLRTFEIIKVLNNHDKLCKNGIIEMYWDKKTKKTNAVFCHPLLHDKIKYKYYENTIYRYLNSSNLGCEIKYLRKINYTTIATKIDPLLAEFMQGRRGNVSQRHYFLPMMNNYKKKWIKVWNKIFNY